MSKREFGIAAVLSIALGLGVVLALGGLKQLFLEGADEELPVIPSVVIAERTATPSIVETPTTEAMLESMILATEEPSSAPIIEIWYGRTQNFGFLGNPQKMVNILGNASDPQGIVSLTYSLNGGPENQLCIGLAEYPNCDRSPRLEKSGDFNVEIANEDLTVGQNRVLITATDNLDNKSTVLVTVQYSAGNTWPLPYVIDWSATMRITDVAQIVDGLWELDGSSIRPAETGYDRLVAIGDIAWADYEVTVPIIIHGFPEPNKGLVRILTGWSGHFVRGTEQPGRGWWNIGALGFFQNADSANGGPYLVLQTDKSIIERSYDLALDLGVPYYFKMRVQTISPDQGVYYSFKVWKFGQPEPLTWQFEKQDEPPNQPLLGSILLVAHDADASFGNVTVVPIEDSAVSEVASQDATGVP